MTYISRQPTVTYADKLTDFRDGDDVEFDGFAESLQITISPGIDGAKLVRPNSQKYFKSSSSATQRNPLDLVGKFVRIAFTMQTQNDPDYPVEWYGYVAAETKDVHAENKSSDQAWDVVGLEWFLARHYITKTEIADGVFVDRAIAYNGGNGSYDRDFREAGNKTIDNGRRVMGGGAGATEWNAFEIATNLLEVHSPKDSAGTSSPCNFVLDAAAVPYLNWFNPVVQTEGRTVLQAINSTIDPRRGLFFWLSFLPDNNTAYFYVTTALPNAFTFAPYKPGAPAATIPGATFKQTVADQRDFPSIQRLAIGEDISKRFDRVRVRGALRTTTFSVPCEGSINQPNYQIYFSRNWTDAQQQAYSNPGKATPEDNDQARRADELVPVFSQFVFKSADPAAAIDGKHLAPRLQPGTNSVVGGVPVDLPAMRLLRQSPINLPGLKPQRTASAGFIYSPQTGKWIRIEEVSLLHEGFANYTMALLDSSPGFEMRSSKGYAHTLAESRWDGADPSGLQPELDYARMLVTVSAELDDYCEAVHPANVTVDDRPVDELVLYVGDRARMDFVAESTVVGVSDTGALKSQIEGFVRDDRDFCELIAVAAKKWYDLDRRPIAAEFARLASFAALGVFIESLRIDQTNVPAVNALVSRLTFNFATLSTQMEALNADIDAGVF